MNAGNTLVGAEMILERTETLSESARRRIMSVRGEPLFYADWLRTVFIHYELDAECLQRAVPFELDLLDGRAYVSLVAFTMRGMRPRIGGKFGALLFKPICSHEFLNVRAYVKHRGETGIYFLAEWLSNPLSVMLGPRSFGLPYRFGKIRYEHRNEIGLLKGTVVGNDPELCLKYRAEIEPETQFAPCRAGSRMEFLLERYTAFTELNGCRRFFRIWHPTWPQTEIEPMVTDNSLLCASWPWFKDAVVISGNYSPGVTDVWMGWPHKTH